MWRYCKHTSFSCRYYTQGRYVQTRCHEYSTRPLQPSRPRPWFPKRRPMSVSPLACNGYSYAPFIANSKTAVHVGCASISWAATLSCLGLCASMTSSIKPEEHNVSQHRQRMTEPRPRVTCTKSLVKIRLVFPETCLRTDKHTQTHVRHHHHNTPLLHRGPSKK